MTKSIVICVNINENSNNINENSNNNDNSTNIHTLFTRVITVWPTLPPLTPRHLIVKKKF